MATESENDARWRALTPQDVARMIGQVKGQQLLAPADLELVGRSVSVRRDQSVHFAAQRRQVGDVGVALLTMSGVRVSGLPSRRSNTVHVGFVLDGTVIITPREADRVVLAPGGCFIITNWSSIGLEARHDTRELHLMLPETLLRERGIRITSTRLLPDRSASLQGPLLALALSTVDPDWAPSISAQRAVAKTLEELAIAFLAESDDGDIHRDDLRAQLRRRAGDEILARHRDASLNPGALARHLGVSLRHLQRSFEGSGTTAAEQILLCRTDSAVALLESPAGRSLTISEQARIAGFSSAYELRSAVRSRFGVLPTELRAASEATTAPQ